MFSLNLVIVGVIISFAGSLSYLLDTLKGKAKPNRITYLLWTIAPLIAFFAEIKQGVKITENFYGYLASVIAAILTFLTITVWGFANIGFPIQILVVNFVMFALVKFKLGKITSR